MACGVIVATVSVIRLIQLCQKRSARQTEIQTYNAATVL